MIQSRDFASAHATASPQNTASDAFSGGISQDLAEIDRRLALMRAAIEPIRTGEMTSVPTDVMPQAPVPAFAVERPAYATTVPASRDTRDPVLAAISMLRDRPPAPPVLTLPAPISWPPTYTPTQTPNQTPTQTPTPTGISGPAVSAVGGQIPSLSNVRPRSHVVSAGWLGDAVRRLAEIDIEAAARVILALLPIQGEVIEGEIAYDLVVEDGLCYSVTVGRTETSIHRLRIPRPLGSIDGRVDTRLETLGALPLSTRLRSLRRSEQIRIVGRRRKQVLAALREVALAPFGLAEAIGIGVSIPPELLLALVAARITPEWTIGHRFTIAFEVGDRSTTEPLFLRVNDGAPAALSRGLPLDLPSATLSCQPGELADVLLGRGGSATTHLAGDRAPLMLVQAWVARLESARG
jgi:hypothetical protein